jgi:hypothetical protein
MGVRVYGLDNSVWLKASLPVHPTHHLTGQLQITPTLIFQSSFLTEAFPVWIIELQYV